MNKDIEAWLIEDSAWMKFAVEKQLLGKNTSSKEAIKSFPIEGIIKWLLESEEGFQSITNGTASYKKEAFWYLYFLADIGFTSSDLEIEDELLTLIKLENENNRFIFSKEMKPDYFCISSILLNAIVRMSSTCKEEIRPHIEMILSKQRLDGGWHCAKNRAVGKKLENTESCPMDNLNILMLLSQYEAYRNDSRLNGAIDLLLSHWERKSEVWRPYGFGIGTQFLKLRYPEAKYGILRVLDVLSYYPYAIKSPSFQSMYSYVIDKQVNGKYIAESIVKAFSDFDFGQKKVESRWITFLIERIAKRIEEI